MKGKEKGDEAKVVIVEWGADIKGWVFRGYSGAGKCIVMPKKTEKRLNKKG